MTVKRPEPGNYRYRDASGRLNPVELRVSVMNPFRYQLDDMCCEGERLLGTIAINGVSMHVEAIMVTDEGGLWQAVNPDYQEQIELAYDIGGADKFQTMTIDGSEYVLVATSYGD